MKYIFLLSFLMFASLVFAQTGLVPEQEQDRPGSPALISNVDSMNYFLGLSLGFDIASLPFDTDLGLVLAGITRAYFGTAELDQQATKDYFIGLQQELQQKQSQQAMQEAQARLEEGENFLDENKDREGVHTTSSGLQYEVLVEGEGPKPLESSRVTVHYEGKLLDGTVFDSSYERGEPASFPLNRVIRGWTEGLQLMPLGSTYKLIIPPDLGYGPRDTQRIPGNSVLVFKIELLGIE
jgi:FKBP-type peptidyl-prolyl cis-trans isomerase FkpA